MAKKKRRYTRLNPARPIDPAAYAGKRERALKALYQRQQVRLQRSLDTASMTDFAKFRAREQLVQINAIIKELNAGAVAWTQEMVPAMYKHGATAARQTALAYGVDAQPLNFGNRINTSAVDVMVQEIAGDLISANASIQRTASRFIFKTRQTALKDRQIRNIIAEGLTTGSTRRAVSKDIGDALYKKMVERVNDGEFIEIKGRSYKSDKYAELVARTQTRAATNQGMANAAIQYGMDLVRIDITPNPCAICQTRQGRVYSLSGNHPDFPQIDTLPPWHPNCGHNHFPVSEEYLKEKGEYGAIKELSNKTPQATTEKDAEAWLAKNKDKRIKSLAGLKSYVKDGDASLVDKDDQ